MASSLIISSFARILIACYLLFAALSKIFDPTWLVSLDVAWAPEIVVLGVQQVLPWVEFLLALALLTPQFWPHACRLTILLLLAFVPVLLVFLLEGRADCGCVSSSSLGVPAATSPAWAIARNLIMSIFLWAGLRHPVVVSRGNNPTTPLPR